MIEIFDFTLGSPVANSVFFCNIMQHRFLGIGTLKSLRHTLCTSLGTLAPQEQAKAYLDVERSATNSDTTTGCN